MDRDPHAGGRLYPQSALPWQPQPASTAALPEAAAAREIQEFLMNFMSPSHT